jgi:hypothetical protein
MTVKSSRVSLPILPDITWPTCKAMPYLILGRPASPRRRLSSAKDSRAIRAAARPSLHDDGPGAGFWPT